jgi:hypothetical protein
MIIAPSTPAYAETPSESLRTTDAEADTPDGPETDPVE